MFVELKNKVDIPQSYAVTTKKEDEGEKGLFDFSDKQTDLRKIDINAKKESEDEKSLLEGIFGIFGKIVNAVVGFFDKIFGNDTPEPVDIDSTKDGKIDSVDQGSNGDCWLLAGINSLSYTTEGQKIIKDSLDYEENGTTVHLKAAGDYFISNEELNDAIATGRYAKGDTDMVILELAGAKIRDDIINKCNYDFSSSAFTGLSRNAMFYDKCYRDLPITAGGTENEMIYYLTGKTGQIVGEPDEKEKMLDEYILSQGKDMALSCGTSEGKRVKTTDGKRVKLSNDHAFSVKSATKDEVTVVNPWDGDKEIKLSKETFLESFDTLSGVNLSKENHDGLVKTTPKVSVKDDGRVIREIISEKGELLREDSLNCENVTKGTKRYVYREDGSKLGVYFGDFEEDKYYNNTYDENGNLVETYEFDGDFNFDFIKNFTYDDNKLVYEEETRFLETVPYTKASSYKYDGNNLKSKTVETKDFDDNLISSSYIEYKNGKIVTTVEGSYKNGKLSAYTTRKTDSDNNISVFTSELEDGKVAKNVSEVRKPDDTPISCLKQYFDTKNGFLRKTTENKFNDNGLVTYDYIKEYEAKDKPSFEREDEFDDRGEKIKSSVTTYKNGTPIRTVVESKNGTEIFEYYFDKKGVLTKVAL